MLSVFGLSEYTSTFAILAESILIVIAEPELAVSDFNSEFDESRYLI